eukprot:5841569-Amphidinium_carterae.1
MGESGQHGRLGSLHLRKDGLDALGGLPLRPCKACGIISRSKSTSDFPFSIKNCTPLPRAPRRYRFSSLPERMVVLLSSHYLQPQLQVIVLGVC